MTDEPASCGICGERPASGHSAEEANHEHPANSLCIGCLIALVRRAGSAEPPPAPRDDAPDDDEDDSAPIVRTALPDPNDETREMAEAERKRALELLQSLGGAFPGIRAEASFEAEFIDYSQSGLRGGRTTEIVDMAMALEWRGTEISIAGTHRLARRSGAPFAESERKRFSDAVSDLTVEAIEEFSHAI